ncbi:uncharacterized protein LOC143266329 [Megachile rotundata]|uniref:uncharacterized protein LOC143266329 n=1 Tax=Megachile rotundata TaxID=143995 RepID=UPI003FD113E3
MAQPGAEMTPVKGKKRRAISSPGIISSDSSEDSPVRPETKKYELPIDPQYFDVMDLKIKGHFYDLKFTMPSKESAKRSQAADDAVNYLYQAYNRITRAYTELASRIKEIAEMRKECVELIHKESNTRTTTEVFEEDINTKMSELKKTIVQEVTQVVKDEIKNTVKEHIPTMGHSTSEQPKSYATIAEKGISIKTRSGETQVMTNDLIEFLIVPLEDNPTAYKTSTEIKKALKEQINTMEFNMRVNHLIALNSVAVRILAKTIDLDKLSESPQLRNIGLKIKGKNKLRPNMLIRNFPTNIPFAEATKVIAEAINIEKDNNEIRILTEYVNRYKRYKSIVLEVTPQIRQRMLVHNRLYINYESCRIEDYIRVLQCFKCLKFNHTAKNCTATTSTCGHCAGDHDSRECKQKEKTRCANCDRSSKVDNKHSALDYKICSIQIKKKKDLTRSIDYEAP